MLFDTSNQVHKSILNKEDTVTSDHIGKKFRILFEKIIFLSPLILHKDTIFVQLIY